MKSTKYILVAMVVVFIAALAIQNMTTRSQKPLKELSYENINYIELTVYPENDTKIATVNTDIENLISVLRNTTALRIIEPSSSPIDFEVQDSVKFKIYYAQTTMEVTCGQSELSIDNTLYKCSPDTLDTMHILYNRLDYQPISNHALTYIDFKQLPFEYTLNDAIGDGVFFQDEESKTYNAKALSDFVLLSMDNEDAFLRKATLSENGDLILIDIAHTTGKFKVCIDSSRSSSGSEEYEYATYDSLNINCEDEYGISTVLSNQDDENKKELVLEFYPR